MNLLITLCARGGSKGIPQKNIKKINGLPLIAYSIKTAFKFKSYFEDIHMIDIDLSTDCDEIKEVAKQFGINTSYSRPSILASDTAGKLDSIRELYLYHRKKNMTEYDLVIDLDISSPLRSLDDLIDAFNVFKDSNALNLFSVNKAHKNPYFNMVEKNNSGYYETCKKLENDVLSRQTAPKVYELNASFYLFKVEFFDLNFNTVYSDKSTIYEMNHICFDLDEPIDFEFMEFLLVNNKLDFEL